MTFPLALDLSGRKCLVVGRSREARQRVENLSRAGADVRWVVGSAGLLNASPPPLGVRVEAREWVPEDTDDVWLVVLADADAEAAQGLRAAADARRVFFCAVDQTALSSFHHVAVIERGPIHIAISSGGRAPALARRLRIALEAFFGDGRLQAFAERLARLRDETPPGARRAVMERALEGFALEGRLRLPGDPPSDP